MLPNEMEVLNKLGVTKEDIDICALYSTGDEEMPSLEYLEGSIDHATSHDREILEGLVKRRTKQIKAYLHATSI